MTDIIETLRDGADDLGAQEFCPYLAKAADKAADEIERLRAALDEIHILAGRQGPPDNIEALNKIEAAAAAILNQQSASGK